MSTTKNIQDKLFTRAGTDTKRGGKISYISFLCTLYSWLFLSRSIILPRCLSTARVNALTSS
jgi:hypothetical protein